MIPTFIFTETCGSAVLIISAKTYEDAWENLEELVKDTEEWRCEARKQAILKALELCQKKKS